VLHAVGIDTVLFGVDGGGAHAAGEWVTVPSVHTLTRTLASTTTACTA
jgi:acetylornithine deacetylase